MLLSILFNKSLFWKWKTLC